jgi:hypothetical protein
MLVYNTAYKTTLSHHSKKVAVGKRKYMQQKRLSLITAYSVSVKHFFFSFNKIFLFSLVNIFPPWLYVRDSQPFPFRGILNCTFFRGTPIFLFTDIK